MTYEFQLGSRVIAEGSAPYVIAEAGVHHRNSLELAKRFVVEAALAGAHAIKFQTYCADRLATRWAPLYWDESSSLTQHEVFSTRSRLTREDYEQLFELANEVGIDLLSTPFDTEAATMLGELGMVAFKTASADLTNTPLLTHIASFGRPVFLSTGASSFEEIRSALQSIEASGCPVVLMHCSLAYPTPVQAANLGRIEALADAFPGYVLGYSDHVRPADTTLSCPMAVVLGATVIEKHFTLNGLADGDDHYHAVDACGLASLVRDCSVAFAATRYLGETTDVEVPARANARRSIVAARDIPAGTVLTATDLDCKRPGTGLSPAMLDNVLGKKVIRNLEMDAQLTFDMLEDA